MFWVVDWFLYLYFLCVIILQPPTPKEPYWMTLADPRTLEVTSRKCYCLILNFKNFADTLLNQGGSEKDVLACEKTLNQVRAKGLTQQQVRAYKTWFYNVWSSSCGNSRSSTTITPIISTPLKGQIRSMGIPAQGCRSSRGIDSLLHSTGLCFTPIYERW
jgi:hypothetical protein